MDVLGTAALGVAGLIILVMTTPAAAVRCLDAFDAVASWLRPNHRSTHGQDSEDYPG